MSIPIVVITKYIDDIPRIFTMSLSFPHLYRQLNSINHSVDIMAKYISLLILLIIPTILFSFGGRFSTTLTENLNVNESVASIAVFYLLLLYTKVVKSVFYRLVKNRFFYRKLFVAENILMSAYMITLIPIAIFANVGSPYQELLIIALFYFVLICYIHYVFIDFKLFIEEKVSYIQLILYFCTVKAVVIGFLIYFGTLVI